MSARADPSPMNTTCLSAAVLVTCLAGFAVHAQTPAAPVPAAAAEVLPAPYELKGDTFVHDPSLIVQDGVFHIFSTGPGLQRQRSPDGVTWTRMAPVFTEANKPRWWAEKVPAHKGVDVWAPKVFQHRGRFHVMYSISTFGKRVSAIGIASADKLDAAEWRDDGWVVSSTENDDFNAIDPDVLMADDGRLWLSYGSFWGGIRLTQLDADSLRPIGETRFVASHRPGIEAPTIIQRDGYYYLFVSWGYCCRGVDSTYHVRVGRSRSPLGPYVDRDGVDLLMAGGTAVTQGGPRWKGPGHQDVFGNVLVWHAYDALTAGKPRLRLSTMNWSADGWPTPGMPN